LSWGLLFMKNVEIRQTLDKPWQWLNTDETYDI
jgi:hypothetical protein